MIDKTLRAQTFYSLSLCVRVLCVCVHVHFLCVCVLCVCVHVDFLCICVLCVCTCALFCINVDVYIEVKGKSRMVLAFRLI